MTDTPNPFDSALKDPKVQKAAMKVAAPAASTIAKDKEVQSAVWGAAMGAAKTGKNPKDAVAADKNVQKAVFGAAVGHYTGSNPMKPKAPPPKPQQNEQSPAYGDNNNGFDAENPQGQNQQWTESKETEEKDKSCWAQFLLGMGVCSAKLPLRVLTILSGCGFIIAGIVDFARYFKGALDLFVNLYLILLGILIFFIEWPQQSWNRYIQARTFYWAAFLARLWGRAALYFFLSILCLSDNKSVPKIVVGIFVFIVVIVMYFVGVTSASKLKRMNVYITKGTEGDERKEMVRQYYFKLCEQEGGKEFLVPEDLVVAAQEAGRELSASERETMGRFFNPDYSGEITLQEWLAGMEEAHKGVRSL